ncbi:hypothetical protein BKP45_00475 [Anaerobacillus alkalidiazotrophicus]|uniref:Uncharacterized protein n=1 Tax=Anaerobacillus alkalidiazotrophicus TaxID=472963 RepID=A0A1S2M9X9_9BACI|nr:ABC transporter permease [Anaerobacillus alkalidiazotrophicus]OIJ21293.1 hypothetical protein BKP45_00475 [Anaerobacillus alkalidiazotrophicus]
MYKHECYKIFTRKSIYFAFLLFVLFILLPGGSNDIIQTEEYQALYEEWRGPLTTEEIQLANKKRSELEEQMYQEVEESGDFEGAFPHSMADRASSYVYSSVVWTGGYIDSFEARKENLLEKAMSSSGSAYEAEIVAKELRMIQKLDQPFGFYNTTVWSSTVDFVNTLGFIILTVLIVLGLSPVFADEHSHKTAPLIVSTKHGKGKVATAKILASFTYIASLFVVLHIINVVLEWSKFGAFVDGTVSLQNLYLFIQSPFGLTIWQYYGVALGIQFFASLVIGLLVLFLSIITRNAMLTFFVSGAIIGTPFMLRQLGLEQQFIQYIIQFSYAELMRVKGLFDQFVAFDVFGQPVLYPYLLLSIFLLVAAVNVLLIFRMYKNQQIMN